MQTIQDRRVFTFACGHQFTMRHPDLNLDKYRALVRSLNCDNDDCKKTRELKEKSLAAAPGKQPSSKTSHQRASFISRSQRSL